MVLISIIFLKDVSKSTQLTKINISIIKTLHFLEFQFAKVVVFVKSFLLFYFENQLLVLNILYSLLLKNIFPAIIQTLKIKSLGLSWKCLFSYLFIHFFRWSCLSRDSRYGGLFLHCHESSQNYFSLSVIIEQKGNLANFYEIF